MPKRGKAKSTESPAGQLTFLSISNPSENKKKFLSKYTALISLLNQDFTEKDYKKEIAIIKRIIAKGFTEKQIYQAFNYRVLVRKVTVTSFALFLWKDCFLLKEAIPASLVEESKPVELDLEDHRTDKTFTPSPKTIIEFLS